MVGRHRALHAIIALGMHTNSNDVGCGIPSSPLDYVGIGMPACPLGSAHIQITSNVACHYRPWTTYTVRQHRAWHVIIALKHITLSDNVERGMPSWSSGSTHAQKTSGVANVERRCQEWHIVIAIGQHPL